MKLRGSLLLLHVRHHALLALVVVCLKGGPGRLWAQSGEQAEGTSLSHFDSPWTVHLDAAAQNARTKYPTADVDAALSDATIELWKLEQQNRPVPRGLVFRSVEWRCIDQFRRIRRLPIDEIASDLLRNEASRGEPVSESGFEELADRIEARAHASLVAARVSVTHSVIHAVLAGRTEGIALDTLAPSVGLTPDKARTILEHLTRAALRESEFSQSRCCSSWVADDTCLTCERESLCNTTTRDDMHLLARHLASNCFLLAEVTLDDSTPMHVLVETIRMQSSILYRYLAVADVSDSIRCLSEFSEIRCVLEALVVTDREASIVARKFAWRCAHDGLYARVRQLELEIRTSTQIDELVARAIRESRGYELFSLRCVERMKSERGDSTLTQHVIGIYAELGIDRTKWTPDGLARSRNERLLPSSKALRIQSPRLLR